MRKLLFIALLALPIFSFAQWDNSLSSSIRFSEDADAQGGDVGVNDSLYLGWSGSAWNTIIDTIGRISKYAGASITDGYTLVGSGGKLILSPAATGTLTSITFASPLTGGTITTTGTVDIQQASALQEGTVTTGTQSFAGEKTFGGITNFNDNIYSNGSTYATGSLFLGDASQTEWNYLGKLLTYDNVTTTDGMLLIGATGAGYYATTLTAGTGIDITNGPGTITIDADISRPSTEIMWGTGTGYSSSSDFTFDDATNKLYANSTNFALGGSNTESFNFHIQENSRVESVISGYTTSKSILAIRRANGTMASPTAILSGETIGDLSWGGYKSTAWSTSSVAAIAAVATETYDDSGTGTELQFQTTANNATGVSTQMTLGQDGNLKLEKQVSEYNNIATVQNGMPSIVESDSWTAQSASMGYTTVYTADEDGFYRISYTAKVTTAATSSSILGPFTYRFTEVDDAVVTTAPSGNTNNINQTAANSTSTGYISGTYIVHAKSGTNIQYAIGYTSSGATAMQYNLHVIVEKL